jgi:hypothetical protein
MRRFLPVVVLLALTGAVHARGLLIPDDRTLPPLAMLNQRVAVTIDDQVAETRVEQTFRNHTDRQLEATYVFPVPRGASVNRFTMQIDGKDVKGELVEADKARPGGQHAGPGGPGDEMGGRPERHRRHRHQRRSGRGAEPAAKDRRGADVHHRVLH